MGAQRKRHFYPRPPRGGRHGAPRLAHDLSKISIHALREEGDYNSFEAWAAANDFYPRPPRGGRRFFCYSYDCFCQFLSTPSARRATDHDACVELHGFISIHALREEGDDTFSIDQAAIIHFYPRPPRGGRPFNEIHKTKMTYISIHALREEGDVRKSGRTSHTQISIHALREEGDGICTVLSLILV